jgi:hypothetical protein
MTDCVFQYVKPDSAGDTNYIKQSTGTRIKR